MLWKNHIMARYSHIIGMGQVVGTMCCMIDAYLVNTNSVTMTKEDHKYLFTCTFGRINMSVCLSV